MWEPNTLINYSLDGTTTDHPALSKHGQGQQVVIIGASLEISPVDDVIQCEHTRYQQQQLQKKSFLKTKQKLT